MAEIDWLRSHVQVLLQQEWGLCRVFADDDGDYFFQHGTAAGWVQVLDGVPPLVTVFAHAAFGVKRSYKLLTELNDIQNRTRACHVYLAGTDIRVEQAVLASGLTQASLAHAIHHVGTVADDVGLLLAQMFGGETPFAPQLENMDDEQDAP